MKINAANAGLAVFWALSIVTSFIYKTRFMVPIEAGLAVYYLLKIEEN